MRDAAVSTTRVPFSGPKLNALFQAPARGPIEAPKKAKRAVRTMSQAAATGPLCA